MTLTIGELLPLLEMKLITGEASTSITGAYTSDLLSDVLAHAEEGNLLITIQSHKNTVAVASHVGAPAIIICGNRPIPNEMVEAARANGITLCLTNLSQFESSGRVHARLNA